MNLSWTGMKMHKELVLPVLQHYSGLHWNFSENSFKSFHALGHTGAL